MLILVSSPFYSHKSHSCTSLIPILFIQVLSFYWSQPHCTYTSLILVLVSSPFYLYKSHSCTSLIPILLTQVSFFYWSQPHCTYTSLILLLVSSPFYLYKSHSSTMHEFKSSTNLYNMLNLKDFICVLFILN